MKTPFYKRKDVPIMVWLICFGLLLAVLAFWRVKPVEIRRLPLDCAGRLALIDDAITCWATNQNQGPFTAPRKKDLVSYAEWDWLLHCPQGGRYTFGSLRLGTKCDVHGHARVVPEVPSPRTQAQLFLEEMGFSSQSGPYQGHARYVCASNLKLLDRAIQQWALTNKKITSDAVKPAEIAALLKGGVLPECPNGGKYIFGSVSNAPQCTIVGHAF